MDSGSGRANAMAQLFIVAHCPADAGIGHPLVVLQQPRDSESPACHDDAISAEDACGDTSSRGAPISPMLSPCEAPPAPVRIAHGFAPPNSVS
jgi:hypothetical protein